MANQFPVQTNSGPTSVESFIADRQGMWARFNKLTVVVASGLAILLIALTIFVV